MFMPERGDKLYLRRKVTTCTADGVVNLRTDPVDEGYVLEIQHLCATGNNSGAAESVDLGYTEAHVDNYVDGAIQTGATNVLVRITRPMYLRPGMQPLAHFAAANTGEILVLVVNGVLRKLP